MDKRTGSAVDTNETTHMLGKRDKCVTATVRHNLVDVSIERQQHACIVTRKIITHLQLQLAA